MISGEYIIKKLLIYIFIQALIVNFSFAEPVPIFFMFSIFKKNEWKSLYNINQIRTISYSSSSPYEQKYIRNDNNTIREYKFGSSHPYDSKFVNLGNAIVEYKFGSSHPYDTIFEITENAIVEYKFGSSSSIDKIYLKEQ